MTKKINPTVQVIRALRTAGQAVGGKVSIEDALSYMLGDHRHLCPKCNGKGFSTIMKDCYPSGLPDSGWATDMKPVDVECSVCEGYGYTVKKMVPKTEVVDYVEES